MKKQLTQGTYEAYIYEDVEGEDDEWFYEIEPECICGRYMRQRVLLKSDGLYSPKKCSCDCGREYSLKDNPDSEFTLLIKYLDKK